MPTIIDSLLVTLGLDPSGYTKGADDARRADSQMRESIKQTGAASDKLSKDQQKGEKDGAETRRKRSSERQKQDKDQLEGQKKIGDSLGWLKGEALALFAAFASAEGLKDFITSTLQGTASLGRFATQLGLSAETVGGWQALARGLGGTSAGAAAALQSLSDIAFQIASTGTTDKVGFMRALGLDRHSLDDASQGLLNIAAGVDRLKAGGQSQQYIVHVLQGVGITDPGIIAALLQGRAATQALLETEERRAKVTAEQTAAAQRAVQVWADLGTSLANVGVQVTTVLEPAIEALGQGLDGIVSWARSLQVSFSGPLPTALLQAWRALTQFLKACQQLLALVPPDVWRGIGTAIEASILKPLREMVDTLHIATDLVKILTDLFKGDQSAAVRDWTQAAKDIVAASSDRARGFAGASADIDSAAAANAAPNGSGRGSSVGSAVGDLFGTSPASSGNAAERSLADRNRNPGNLEDASGRYRRFPTREAGLGAMARQILSDFYRHGQRTIRQLIGGPHGWSPAGAPGNSPASTANYEKYVAGQLGVSVDAPINMSDPGVLRPLMQAMAQFEAGRRSVAIGALNLSGVTRAAATGATISHSSSRSTSVQATTHVGAVHVNVPNGDPKTIASGVGGALRRHTYVPHFATSLV